MVGGEGISRCFADSAFSLHDFQLWIWVLLRKASCWLRTEFTRSRYVYKVKSGRRVVSSSIIFEHDSLIARHRVPRMHIKLTFVFLTKGSFISAELLGYLQQSLRQETCRVELVIIFWWYESSFGWQISQWTPGVGPTSATGAWRSTLGAMLNF